MTIKSLSKLVSVTLGVILISFAVAASWSLKQLNASFASVEFFGQQKDKIFTQVSQPIFSYLLTSEATILGDVDQSLSKIKAEVKGRSDLSLDLQSPFIALIDEVQQTTLVELASTGKLADPQTLLINNEKQLSRHLQKLLLYANQAKKSSLPKQQLYLRLVSESQAKLLALASARQSFFTSRQQMSVDNVIKPLQSLIALSGDFAKLPLLGVMKQLSVGTAFSLDSQAEKKSLEDMAIEPIREIPSLLQHYSKDMALAITVAQNKVTGQAKVGQQINVLQGRLLTLETELAHEYQFYERLMLIIIGVFTLLIISAVLACVLGGARILRRVSELELIMAKIAHTSDLSLRTEASHSDEIGSMAKSFNLMIEKLQETSVLVRQKINDIQAMLKNMPQGLLSFDGENKVHAEYSAYLEKILETNQIAGADMITLIFEGSTVGSDTKSQIASVSSACVGEDAMNFEFNRHLLVSEVEKVMADGLKKILDLNWAPVINEEDVVEQILLCVRDVTELRKLSAETAEQKCELAIIGEVLGVDQEKFHQFIASAGGHVAEIERVVLEAPQGGPEAISLMFRNMHTIKGNARTYGLTRLSDHAHDTESIYATLRQADAVWDQFQLLDDLAKVRQLIARYTRISEVSLGRKWLGGGRPAESHMLVDSSQVQDAINLLERAKHSPDGDLIMTAHKLLSQLGTEPMDTVFSALIDSLPALAESLGKPPPRVSISNGSVRLKSQFTGVVNDIFTHLFRNCIDHGVEIPADRVASNKSLEGRIDVAIRVDGELLKIAIKDDGRGLALNKIRQKALANGLLRENEVLSDESIAALIFLPGFSTADQLTDISGRGVGMDVVVDFARKEGGQVSIRFLDNQLGHDYRDVEFLVCLPGHYVASDKALVGVPA